MSSRSMQASCLRRMSSSLIVLSGADVHDAPEIIAAL